MSNCCFTLMGLRRCLEISKSYLCMCVSGAISGEEGSVALWEWGTEQDEIIGKRESIKQVCSLQACTHPCKCTRTMPALRQAAFTKCSQHHDVPASSQTHNQQEYKLTAQKPLAKIVHSASLEAASWESWVTAVVSYLTYHLLRKHNKN